MDQNKLLDGISVVIPVYNSAEILPDLIARLAPVLDNITAAYEAILIEDGSRDESWAVIERLSEANVWVRGIRMMRNYGQHNALLCGLRAACFTCTVTIDDDLQHPPEEIPLLLEKIAQGYDVVYGTPAKQQHGLWRNLASYITRLALQSTMGIENARKVSAFRAIRTQVRQAFAHYQSPFVVLDVLLGWGTTRFASATTQHLPRQSGKSNYTFSKLILHGVNMLTGFSVLPLQMASLMGFASAFFGILIFFYVIGRFFIEGGSVPGFPFLASIIAIFSGVQLFAIGIIGEYLARMHFRIMERPPYVVREETGDYLND
ncbi:MAG: glycosyltransferase [Anaerolineae bacterium UTCFX2]|jgi:undecaprenyl-phosphate 4-deoxy-4-formamido-L-arabinose transferase|nr:glycosyltransferase family 2 protein [Anaerolineae bacterium]MCZ7551045.1 glycosyltransferase family 2 protein [Anaerolineales bacterium]OQY94069.1 MAG: glycosyltransferase [Anaerolineae bacterium UTCFX2]